MKRFLWFWKYHVGSFYWLISKLIPWTLSFWINEIHAQECLGASMTIKFSTVFGMLLFFSGYLCFGCKQGTLSSGHWTILGLWGRQTNAPGHLHHKYSHLAAQQMPFCRRGGHTWAWLLLLNFGIFLFPSPVVCPCHVLAFLCHFKQLCVCQAGFSQLYHTQLCDKEFSFAKVKLCPLFSLLGGSRGSCFLTPCRIAR